MIAREMTYSGASRLIQIRPAGAWMKGIKMIIGIDPDQASIQSHFSISSASLLSISSQMAMPLQDLGDLPFLHRL